MSASPRITIAPAVAESPHPAKRRQYSIAEKRRMVEETLQPGTSVARVARAHGVNANQVFGWRRLYQRGRLGGTVPTLQSTKFLPVTISELPVGSVAAPGSLSAGTIQLQSPRGRVRIDGAVDPESLRLILQCMLA